VSLCYDRVGWNQSLGLIKATDDNTLRAGSGGFDGEYQCRTDSCAWLKISIWQLCGVKPPVNNANSGGQTTSQENSTQVEEPELVGASWRSESNARLE